MSIIAFVGPVGVGKSTHIRYLASYLSKKNVRVKCTYLKTYFPLTKAVLKVFSVLKVSPNALFRVHRLLVAGDLTLNIIILPIVALFRIRLALYFTRIILVEEYLPGILVDYFHAMKVLNIDPKLIAKLMNILFRLLYVDDLVTVILSARYSSLRRRWCKRESPDEHLSYLKAQERVFNTWRRVVSNVVYIRTDNKAIGEVNREVRELFSF